MLLLNDEEVKTIISMKEAINIVERAFNYYSNNKAKVPSRTQIKLSKNESIALYMPGYSESLDSLGLKVITVFPKNIDFGLKTINALVILNSIQNGEPIALIEANYLTALRTGAASGVATKYLSKTDASKIAIIGAGYQARTQLEAICCVRNIIEVNVYDIDFKRADKYIKDMKKKLHMNNIYYRVASSAKEAVNNVDIICTTTTSKTPLFKMIDLKAGVHINAIGSFTPKMQEIDEEIIFRANKICVDSLKGTLKEAGDLIIPINKGLIDKQKIYCEIGKIIDGEKVGRENNKEITIFKTVGISIQDIAVGMYAYRKANELGLGKHFNFGNG